MSRTARAGRCEMSDFIDRETVTKRIQWVYKKNDKSEMGWSPKLFFDKGWTKNKGRKRIVFINCKWRTIKVSYWRSKVRKKIDFFFSKASRKRQGPAPERKKTKTLKQCEQRRWPSGRHAKSSHGEKNNLIMNLMMTPMMNRSGWNVNNWKERREELRRANK